MGVSHFSVAHFQLAGKNSVDSECHVRKLDCVNDKTYLGRTGTMNWLTFIDKIGDPTWATAVASIAVAVFTGTLWWSTRGMLKATSDNIKLMRDHLMLGRNEFISTHRPKIILREAIIGSVLEGKPISVIMHFANVGETAGTIVRSHVSVEIVSVDRLMLHPTVDNTNDFGEIKLGPGEARLVRFPKETPTWEGEKFKLRSLQTTEGVKTRRDFTVHLVGQLIYMDELRTPRRTAFRRELYPERQRFYRIMTNPILTTAISE
jgi:hypothetical protein